VPKISTSIIGSLWALTLINLIGDPFNQATQNLDALLVGFAASPIILYLGLLSPVIVAEMVKNNGKLLNSTKTALSYTPRLIKTGLILLVFSIILTAPTYLGLLAYILYNNILFGLMGVLATLIGAVVMSYKLYFLPVTLTENKALNSIKESSKASKTHKKEVLFLLIISITLLILSIFSSGVAQRLGMLGFILGRALSSAITTYTLIVAPKAYMKM